MSNLVDEFICTECHRHIINLCGPSTSRCAACIALPNWYNDPALRNLLDPEYKNKPELEQTICPGCNTNVISYWQNGLITRPEYVLAGDTIFHTNCWNKVVDEYRATNLS